MTTSTSSSTRSTTSRTGSAASPTISAPRASRRACCWKPTSSPMRPEGDEPRRYEWQVGTMVVPPNMWFHQHFNTGTTPARYLAFKHEGVAIRNVQGVPKAWISRRAGGDQIDYADENPET